MLIFCRNIELSFFKHIDCISDNQNQKESFLWSFYLGKVRNTGAPGFYFTPE